MNQTVRHHIRRKEIKKGRINELQGKRKREVVKLLQKISVSELFGNGSSVNWETYFLSWEMHRALEGK